MNNADNYMKFLESLKVAIKEANITQGELGEAVGVSSNYISLIVTEKRRASESVREAIAEYFGKTLSEFIGNSAQKSIVMRNHREKQTAKDAADEVHKIILDLFSGILDAHAESESNLDMYGEILTYMTDGVKLCDIAVGDMLKQSLGRLTCNPPGQWVIAEMQGCKFFYIFLPPIMLHRRGGSYLFAVYAFRHFSLFLLSSLHISE